MTSPDPRCAKIDALVAQARRSGKLGEVQLAMESGDRSLVYRSSPQPRPYFIASATKLYVTALLARLRDQGRVDWDAPMANYLPNLDLSRLHVLHGQDHTQRISVRHLLAHTSGLADYFEQKRKDGGTTFGRAVQGDFAWTLPDVVAITRDQLTAKFTPGAANKAFYSDTNYQLLGGIIEAAYGQEFAQVVARELAEPLGLTSTWCFGPQSVSRYAEVAPMLLGRQALQIPLAMASVQADGGLVSSVDDSLVFLRAFFGGQLFSPAILAEIQGPWRSIFFPLSYGTGVMRFALPRILTLFRRFPPVVGHSGASGALMFYCPEWDLYVAGTVNQVEQRSQSFQLMIKALDIARRPAAGT